MQPKDLVLPTRGTYFSSLDGLRGMGLLAVMFGHFGEKWGAQPHGFLEKAYFDIAACGWIALEFFFVLSGFLITAILLDTRHKKNFFQNFYLRRVLRIFPLYYLGLVVLFFALPGILQDLPGYRELRAEQIWHWLYLQNWAIVFRGSWHPFRAVNHLWSLAVEEQFYLVWPLVVYYLGARRMIPLCLAMIAVAVSLRIGIRLDPRAHEVAAYTMTFARMDPLAIGSLVAIVARIEGGMMLMARWCGVGAVTTLALLVCLMRIRHTFYCGDPGIQTAGYFIMSIFGACAILYLITRAETNPFVRFFRNKTLVFAGTVSYAAYLVHLPVMYLIHDNLHLPQGLPEPVAHGIIFSLMTFLTFGLATLIWHAFEKQVLKLKDVLAPHAPKPARDPGPREAPALSPTVG